MTVPPSPPVVLASGSPYRARLLRDAGLAVIVDPPELDEAPLKRALRAMGAPAAQAAVALAEAKARAVSPAHPGALVIGGDQIAALPPASSRGNGVGEGGSGEEVWLDKPTDMAAARDQLWRLRDRAHLLETAVVLVRDGETIWSHLARPRVILRAFSESALDHVLAAEGETVLSCVGGYRVEGPGLTLFQALEGDVFAIQGLPLLPLIHALHRFGVLTP